MSDLNLVLYDYWRSSASYRVRIALHLKGLPFKAKNIDLLTNQHHSPAYRRINPQGKVPALRVGEDKILTQSLAIIDYLEILAPKPSLIPKDPEMRHLALRYAYMIAMEIHPICIPKVARYAVGLKTGGASGKQQALLDWMRHFIDEGLKNLEEMLMQNPRRTDFACGNTPGIFECCLIPQLYNAKRWDVSYGKYRILSDFALRAENLPAFKAAHPDKYMPKTPKKKETVEKDPDDWLETTDE